jgi:hypothetical protein
MVIPRACYTVFPRDTTLSFQNRYTVIPDIDPESSLKGDDGILSGVGD